ncbi:MAG: hypothetical protein KF724_10900 [Phycisphaeraceae bacterium]|nr:hypothetical protein [Phycisphaeraceae bacterium]
MTREPCQRVEIVVDQPHLSVVIDAIRDASADGWTVLREVSGSGGRGEQWADDLSGSGSNVMIIVAAERTVVDRVLQAVAPILREAGGICLVSDAVRLLPGP